jgi:hypothetical protein
MSSPKGVSAAGATDSPLKFRLPGATKWEEYGLTASHDDHDTSVTAARERLSSFLTSSLQMQHLLVLAGSGTSFGVEGPKMAELWEKCIGASPSDEVKRILKALSYGTAREERDVEELLSRCDAFLSFNTDAGIEKFRHEAITKILTRCREPGSKPEHDLGLHKEFLRRLARRRARDTRLRLFTTNYDLCFEKAAGELGLVALDGFSFSQPRRFDPRFFEYDIVHRGSGTADTSHSFCRRSVSLFQTARIGGLGIDERRGHPHQSGRQGIECLPDLPCPHEVPTLLSATASGAYGAVPGFASAGEHIPPGHGVRFQ